MKEKVLPEKFVEEMSALMNADELEEFIRALAIDDQTVSVRINRAKCSVDDVRVSLEENSMSALRMTEIGWCEDGYYLSERPQFTLDPLFHAGCYYVQEASSMFVSHILSTFVRNKANCLDLCAAPGGKSTAALGVLPEGSYLISNEIDRRRARILAENITKWGNPNVTVTCSAPKDFRKFKNVFDVIITDVPCSGEGMFRKDEGAIADWSLAKVEGCAALQKEIVETIWDCLRPGGLFIYSTCTFNSKEDEEIVEYICSELGGEAQEVPVKAEWNIHPPLLGSRPCYRFMPHYTKGEGLFMAAIRKDGEATAAMDIGQAMKKYGKDLYILQAGIESPAIKGKDVIPSHAQALATVENDYPKYEISKEMALDYLRRMALILPDDAPRGYVVLTYRNHSLGFVKNLGNRCNNLYPQEWRIRNL